MGKSFGSGRSAVRKSVRRSPSFQLLAMLETQFPLESHDLDPLHAAKGLPKLVGFGNGGKGM